MKDFKQDFHFGKKDTTVYEYAIIGFLLDLFLSIMTEVFKFDRKKTMRLVDQLNRKFGRPQKLNDYIIRDDEWLDVRVSGDIDEAVEEVKLTEGWDPVTMNETVIIEKEPDGSEAQSLLGGEMRATYDFVIREEDSNEL